MADTTGDTMTGKMTRNTAGRRAVLGARGRGDSPQTLDNPTVNIIKDHPNKRSSQNINRTVLVLSLDTQSWTVCTVETLARYKSMLWMLQTTQHFSVVVKTLTVHSVTRCCPFRWVELSDGNPWCGRKRGETWKKSKIVREPFFWIWIVLLPIYENVGEERGQNVTN